ncbi:hypothetical protein OH76DRAFT_1096263 [Lentinus brumalis]|uniref:Uncharacterized protein n=1 Tax=Lentinus brumalis TaxID=2498619 RepID=A0A371CW53_9APHY|nr:hypothetical protein OH76DRAFT_1096263 [Polyporus brumalis]
MFEATADNRGTLQQLAQELEVAYADADGNASFRLSSQTTRSRMPAELYWQLVIYLKDRNPFQEFHSIVACPRTSTSILIADEAQHYNHITLNGHTYHASRRSRSSKDSFALIQTSGGAGLTWAGEIVDIFSYDVPGIQRRLVVHVKWLRPRRGLSLQGTPWAEFLGRRHIPPYR